MKVKILGNEYLVKGQVGGDDVSRVAEFLNQKIKEIESHADGLSEKKTVILAALHIAGEYLQLLREHQALVMNIDERSKALIRHIDSVAV